MATEVEDLTLRILRDIQQEQKQIRRDHLQVRETPRALGQTLRRSEIHLEIRLSSLETRLSGLRSDVEATLKLAIGGQLAHFESRLEAKLDAVLAELSANMTSKP